MDENATMNSFISQFNKSSHTYIRKYVHSVAVNSRDAKV